MAETKIRILFRTWQRLFPMVKTKSNVIFYKRNNFRTTTAKFVESIENRQKGERKDEANMKKLYIAYGSNMDEEQMAFRCPTATLVGTAIVEGYELMFKGSRTGSYATIEPKEGSIVPVLVWEIGQMDERRLDYYEGYPNFYYKKMLEVQINGKMKRAMVYIMDEQRKIGVPSAGYYRILEQAYEKFGFEGDVLEQALKNSIEEVQHGISE